MLKMTKLQSRKAPTAGYYNGIDCEQQFGPTSSLLVLHLTFKTTLTLQAGLFQAPLSRSYAVKSVLKAWARLSSIAFRRITPFSPLNSFVA